MCVGVCGGVGEVGVCRAVQSLMFLLPIAVVAEEIGVTFSRPPELQPRKKQENT